MSLLGISRLLANRALALGGTWVQYYKWEQCPNVRPDGKPCYDSKSGTGWAECRVCKTVGYHYKQPQLIRAVYTDRSNEFVPDGAGGWLMGKKTLSIPWTVYTSLMKPTKGGRNDQTARQLGRDKFVILDSNGNPIEVLYLDKDPTQPFISGGVIYKIVELANNF